MPIAQFGTKVFLEYLREQFASAVSQMQKREECSEVLVGFDPDLEPVEKEQLGLASEASSHQEDGHPPRRPGARR